MSSTVQRKSFSISDRKEATWHWCQVTAKHGKLVSWWAQHFVCCFRLLLSFKWLKFSCFVVGGTSNMVWWYLQSFRLLISKSEVFPPHENERKLNIIQKPSQESEQWDFSWASNIQIFMFVTSSFAPHENFMFLISLISRARFFCSSRLLRGPEVNLKIWACKKEFHFYAWHKMSQGSSRGDIVSPTQPFQSFCTLLAVRETQTVAHKAWNFATFARERKLYFHEKFNFVYKLTGNFTHS